MDTNENLQYEGECMEVLELAGRIIIENGGEIYRVEETISRMGRGLQLDRAECFAVPSGLFISCQKGDSPVETSILRIRTRAINLEKVDQVNQVSRDVECGRLDYAGARAALTELQEAPSSLSHPVLSLGVGISAAGFALMFGGDLLDFLIAFCVGFLGWLITGLFPRMRLSGSAQTLILSFLFTISVSALFRTTGWGQPDAIIPGVLMSLVPGLAMTSAVQDQIRGDSLSGMTSGMNAFLTAILIAAGALLGTHSIALLFTRLAPAV